MNFSIIDKNFYVFKKKSTNWNDITWDFRVTFTLQNEENAIQEQTPFGEFFSV